MTDLQSVALATWPRRPNRVAGRGYPAQSEEMITSDSTYSCPTRHIIQTVSTKNGDQLA